MKSKKRYSNVYTILEKVKKGEIINSNRNQLKDDSVIRKTNYYDNISDGLFGKINFWKRPDLIKPYMHWLDENRFEAIMDAYLNNPETIKKEYKKWATHKEYDNIPASQKPDVDAFTKKFIENYKKFPKHLQKDIFKLYYHTMNQLDFEKRDDKNFTKYKFLEKANNPVGKIMTEHSNVKSAIFTRSIMSYFINKMTQMEYVDAETSKTLQNGLNGQGDENDINNAMAKMNSLVSNKDMDAAIKNATQSCKDLDENMDQETQQSMFEQAGESSEAGKLSTEYLKQVTENLQSVKISIGAMKNQIKKLLDKSVSYFSSKKITTHEDLFNTDNTAGIEDFELLHPKLRKIFIEDILVKNTKSIGKLNLYIDVSGSMSSSIGVNNSLGKSITKLDFCKAFAAKLLEMDMLNNLYLFDNRVKNTKKDIISISMIGCGGGTTIDAACKHIQKDNINSIIITDAEDHCSIYDEHIFFIGVQGATFNNFANHVITSYSEGDQVVIFDGNRIDKIWPNGTIYPPKEQLILTKF